MLEILRRRRTGEEGQTTTEYAVVLTLITAGCVAAIAALATSEAGAVARVVGIFPG